MTSLDVDASTASDAPNVDASTVPATVRQRRWRRRKKAGVTSTRVDVTDAHVRMLEENGYLEGGRYA
jgi:hypothetical protein